MENRKEDKENKAFKEDVAYFLAKDQFTIHDFQERVMKSSFKMMIWGDDAEMKVLEQQNKICSAMYDEEKTYPDRLTYEIKKDIAETTQLKISDINDVMAKYQQLYSFHKWLKQRNDREDPMPDTRDELFTIYRVERPKFLFPQKHKTSYPKRVTKYQLRRHYT